MHNECFTKVSSDRITTTRLVAYRDNDKTEIMKKNEMAELGEP